MNFSWTRIAFGVAVLAGLAIWDLWEHGRSATRWREYAFLALCTAVAMAYGIVNDHVTSRISWEYFYYGKELSPVLGPQVPPDPGALSWQAVRIGAAATWWAGLLLGAALLIANNRSRPGPQVSYARLAARLPVILGITIGCAILLGCAGYLGLLNGMSPDFGEMAATNLWRPKRFMAVYGVHLGGYVGGVISLVYGFASVVRERRRMGGVPPVPGDPDEGRAKGS